MRLSDLANPDYQRLEPYESLEVAELKQTIAAKQVTIDEFMALCEEMLTVINEKDQRIEDLCILCDSVGNAALLKGLTGQSE